MDYAAIEFKNEFGYWWPSHDHKPEASFNELRKGLSWMDFAISLCTRRRLALQAGGHAGLWPLRLSGHYDRVITFEPQAANFECLTRNCAGKKNIEAQKLALGARNNTVLMRPSVSSGTWRVDAKEGKVECKQITIDLLALTDLDALFLDIEGYEPQALLGARETIKRCRPIIHVEMLPRSSVEIARTLNGMGYFYLRKVGRDAVFAPGR